MTVLLPVLLPALLAGLLAFVVAWVATWLLVRVGTRLRLVDTPNERSLHDRPKPRSGGLAIVAGILAATGAGLAIDAVPQVWLVVLAATAPVAIVSYIDDRIGVPPALRLPVHLVAAAALVAVLTPTRLALPGLDAAVPAWLAMPVAGLAVVWMTNLYNFMDGIDGIAGGMAVLGFVTLAGFGLAGGAPGYALAMLAVAAAAGGFLWFNFPPSRLFMGDAGSSTLGFLAAAGGLWGADAGLFRIWVPLVVFAPFIVDATATLLRRLARGDRVWQAHREHYYQRLVLSGWSHRRTTLAYYGAMVAAAAAAGAAAALPPGPAWAVLGLLAAGYATAMWRIDRLPAPLPAAARPPG